MSEFDNRSPEDVGYGLDLPYHLAESAKEEIGMASELCELLTEFDFIEYKVSGLAPQPLIDDYEFALAPEIHISEEKKESLRLIQGAIRLSANILSKEPTQLSGHLLGRLMFSELPEIQLMLEGIKQKKGIWLRPLTSSLKVAGGYLLRTMTDDNKNQIRNVAMTSDGKWAISGSTDKTLILWNLANGTQKFILNGHRDTVTTVAMTSDGKWAISGSTDKTLILWNLANGTQKFILNDTGKVTNVTITTDCKWALSAADVETDVKISVDMRYSRINGTMKLWNLDIGILDYSLFFDNDSIESLTMTPDRKWAIYSGNNKNLILWNLSTKKEQNKFLCDGHGTIQSVAITPDGRYAISGSDDKTLKLWDLNNGIEKLTILGHSAGITCVAITPNGRYAISGSNDKTLKLWDFINNNEHQSQQAHLNRVYSVAVTLDGHYALSSSSGGSIKLWDLNSGIEKFNLIGHDDRSGVFSVTIAADGQWAISGSTDKSLKLWDLTTGIEQRTLSLSAHTATIYSVAITADRQWAVCASQDSLRLWNLTNEAESYILANINGAKVVALEPDGHFVVWATGHRIPYICKSFDYTLKIWDLHSQTEMYILTGHTSWITSIAVTADKHKRWAISGSMDCTLKLWDLDNGIELQTLTDHTSYVNAVAITPDGKYAVSGSDDENLKVWSLETGKVLASFRGESAFTACAIASNGLIIVAGEESGQVHFLRLQGLK